MLVNDEDLGPHGAARAAGENADVVHILEILGEHDATMVEEGGQLPDGKVLHAPWVLELDGDASVQDQAPEGSGCLVQDPQRLDEEWERAPAWVNFDDALPDPRGELGGECDFGSLVALPAGAVGST